MELTSKMSKEKILKTVEDFYNETSPDNLGRLYTLNELAMRLNPKPKGYVKKGASKILKLNSL
jgi:hypothetical protein